MVARGQGVADADVVGVGAEGDAEEVVDGVGVLPAPGGVAVAIAVDAVCPGACVEEGPDRGRHGVAAAGPGVVKRRQSEEVFFINFILRCSQLLFLPTTTHLLKLLPRSSMLPLSESATPPQ